MIEHTRRLPIKGPRHYTLRDAYRDRVWRSPSVVIGRELLSWSVAGALFGFLSNHNGLYALGVVGILSVMILIILGSLSTNWKRTKLIRTGHSAIAHLEQPRRVILMHELLRGEREKTFVLRFGFTDQDGVEQVGKVWICGCAKKYFPPGSQTPIVYQGQTPSKAIPLRLAVMVAPH